MVAIAPNPTFTGESQAIGCRRAHRHRSTDEVAEHPFEFGAARPDLGVGADHLHGDVRDRPPALAHRLQGLDQEHRAGAHPAYSGDRYRIARRCPETGSGKQRVDDRVDDRVPVAVSGESGFAGPLESPEPEGALASYA